MCNIATCSDCLLTKSFMLLKLSLMEHLTAQTLRSLNLLELSLLLTGGAWWRSDGRWSNCNILLLILRLLQNCITWLRLLLLTLAYCTLLLLIKIWLSKFLCMRMMSYIGLFKRLALPIHLCYRIVLFLALVVVYMLNLAMDESSTITWDVIIKSNVLRWFDFVYAWIRCTCS